MLVHDDVIKWKHFPRYWQFVRGIHRFPVNSPHKGQWRGASTFSLICVGINGWVNNRKTGDLRRHPAHYDVIVMVIPHTMWCIPVPSDKQRVLSLWEEEPINSWVLMKISLKLVHNASVNKKPALVQIMVCRQRGDKPLSEPKPDRLVYWRLCVIFWGNIWDHDTHDSYTQENQNTTNLHNKVTVLMSDELRDDRSLWQYKDCLSW